MQALANPTRFLAIQSTLQPWLWAATVLLFAVGLYLGLVEAPADYQQGETVRIMFIHVPAAWLALSVYTLMALASVIAIVFRHPLADVAAKSAAPIGATFTFLALATGSIWGQPTWGTWWVWDARLASMFVLFLLYLGYIAVWQAIDEWGRAARVARIVAIVGFLNVPIIKYSVDWWNTLHQPASVLRLDGPAIHVSILVPLLVMALASMVLFLALHLLAIRTEVMARRIRQMQLAAAGKA
ncbi:MAG TPA: heme ABC transporter permease [Aestuariivirgaceae bacterium]|nr:heme ABC transporter permease [Aestuariivirgaceae bacterium]